MTIDDKTGKCLALAYDVSRVLLLSISFQKWMLIELYQLDGGQLVTFNKQFSAIQFMIVKLIMGVIYNIQMRRTRSGRPISVELECGTDGSHFVTMPIFARWRSLSRRQRLTIYAGR